MKQKTAVHNIIKQTEAEMSRASGAAWLMQYLELFTEVRKQLFNSLNDQSIQLPTSDEARQLYKDIRGHELPDWDEVTKHSKFHAILMDPAWQQHMKEDVQFLTLRVIVNFLYLILQQLGVKPLERYLLCWFFAKGIEELKGIDTVSYIQEFSTS